jgi:PhnB protein
VKSSQKVGPEKEDLRGPALGVTPILVVDNAAAAVSFYKSAFSANEVARIAAPDGERLLHVRLELLGTRFIVMDELAEVNGMGSQFHAPAHLKGTSVTLHLQVENGTEIWDAALKTGAEEVIPFKEQFWGELYGRLRDPFGHEWTIAQFLRHVPDADIEQAADTIFRT